MLSVLLTLSVVSAWADDMEDTNKLVGAGKYAEALQKANDFLAKNPRDADMRFLKGIIFTEQNKSPEAMAVFTQLIDDYPNLPEPYNNLATLLSASGQFERARSALEKAIRLNPSYVTARENLGDVYIMLATQEYNKVLQIDARSASAKTKLTAARHLMNAFGTPTVPDVASLSAPARPIILGALRTVAAQAPVANVNVEAAEVLTLINAWVAAWSVQDVKKYLAFYGDDFVPLHAQSRKVWAEERHARIAGKSRINVKVESPQVKVDGNTAIAKFRQIYVSDNLTDTTMKTLVLKKLNGLWRIKSEQAG